MSQNVPVWEITSSVGVDSDRRSLVSSPASSSLNTPRTSSAMSSRTNTANDRGVGVRVGSSHATPTTTTPTSTPTSTTVPNRAQAQEVHTPAELSKLRVGAEANGGSTPFFTPKTHASPTTPSQQHHHQQVESDEAVARSLQEREDEISAQHLASNPSPLASNQHQDETTHSEAPRYVQQQHHDASKDPDNLVAASLQMEESILRNVPVRDDWHGDTGMNSDFKMSHLSMMNVNMGSDNNDNNHDDDNNDDKQHHNHNRGDWNTRSSETDITNTTTQAQPTATPTATATTTIFTTTPSTSSTSTPLNDTLATQMFSPPPKSLSTTTANDVTATPRVLASPSTTTTTPTSSPTTAKPPPTMATTTTNKALVCARQGYDHLKNDEIAKAKICFERGLAMDDVTDLLRLKLHAQLGNISRELHEYSNAITHMESYLLLTRSLNVKNEEYLALRMLAITNFNYGIFLNNDVEKVDVETNMALAGDLMSKSLQRCEELVKLAEADADLLVAARAYRDLTKVHLVLKNDMQALDAAEKHLSAIRGRGTRKEIARAVGAAATLRLKTGESGEGPWYKADFDAALELFWEQAAIGEELGDHYLSGKAYYEISKLLETAGSWAQWFGPAKARQYLEKAKQGYQQAKALSTGQKAELDDIEQRLVALNSDDGCHIQ